MDISNEAESYIRELFQEKLPPNTLYHNYSHAKEVVTEVTKMAEHYKLQDESLNNLLLAAWFHDTGYIDGNEGHEEKSVEIANEFLRAQKYNQENIAEVGRLIRSTDFNYKPETLDEKILHDADIASVGKKRFFRKGDLLRLEWEALNNQQYSDEEWEEIQLKYLLKAGFLTDYAYNNYQKRKSKNIIKQKAKLKNLKNKELNFKGAVRKYGRGIETLYRSTYRNHINLSSIADGKANMMISINTIIMSLIVTLMGSGFTFSSSFVIQHLRFAVPVLILLVGALLSAIFAVLSARPKVTNKMPEDEAANVDKSKKSVVFFGNYVNMTKDNFQKALAHLKNDQDLLYTNMSADLYDLGHVLNKKYRLLRISYNIFMFALIACVGSFLGIFIFTNF